MAKLDEKIGFIGGGNMAFAIGSGLVSRGIVKPTQILAAGPNLINLDKWRDIGADVTTNSGEAVARSDIVFICVKPHILETCAKQIQVSYNPSSRGDKDKIFVSVLAGVSLENLMDSFNFLGSIKMIRCMPNTPMQVGEGCTVYTPGQYVSHQDLEKIHLILNSLGIAQQVPEKLINAVGAVAGCGPAYVYTIIEAMADGGVRQGIPRQLAIQFAAQTVFGAAKTVLETEKHPAILRDEVCSPGGATIAAIHELEKGGLRAALMNAIQAATEKAHELGQKK